MYHCPSLVDDCWSFAWTPSACCLRCSNRFLPVLIPVSFLCKAPAHDKIRLKSKILAVMELTLQGLLVDMLPEQPAKWIFPGFCMDGLRLQGHPAGRSLWRHRPICLRPMAKQSSSHTFFSSVNKDVSNFVGQNIALSNFFVAFWWFNVTKCCFNSFFVSRDNGAWAKQCSKSERSEGTFGGNTIWVWAHL